MKATFSLQPTPSVSFPAFTFGPNTDGKTAQVTHTFLDVARNGNGRKVQRQTTDTLSLAAARDLYGALLKLGFKAQ